MLRGIGIDLVNQTRIERLIVMEKRRMQFIYRILTPLEQQELLAKTFTPKLYGNFLAKRYAVKEAFAKAYGSGIGGRLSFQQLTLTHRSSGQPILQVDTAISGRWPEPWQVLVSLTDEYPLVQAMVTIEYN